VQHSVANR
ncbi:hypothetical protein D031_3647B, partial [Vibrio parahaemolyticus VP-48]